jgi:hypothetical protein
MTSARQVRSATRKRKKPVSILKQLSSYGIQIPRRNEVLGYLAQHIQLGRLLPEVCAQVRQAFGSNVELSLELYRDPEIDDRYLTLYVRQQAYDTEIMDRIETVSRQFNGRLERVAGYLLLTTDFHRPRINHAV